MRPEDIIYPNALPVKAFVRCANEYPYHWHDVLEIVQVLKGSVKIGLGNDDLLLRENDVAIVNIGELHRMTKSDGDDEILFIHIDGAFCSSLLPDNNIFIYCCSQYHEAKSPENIAF